MRILPLCAAAAVAAACGAPEQAPPMIHELAIVGSDFAFVAPDSVPAGLTHITLENKGPNLHHVQFVRLDSGKAMADLMEAMKTPGPFPAWAVMVPGPNAPDPGSTSNITVELAQGNYAIICLVDIPGGVPHFAKGMTHALKVTAPMGAVAAMPAADVTIELSDYAFAVSKPLSAGSHVIEVVTKGPQPHEVEILRFAPGKTMDDLGKWMQKMEGPPPASAIGGTSAQMPGTKAQFTVDLTPGDYAIVCFIPDAKDGKPHLEHGMVQMFKIE